MDARGDYPTPPEINDTAGSAVSAIDGSIVGLVLLRAEGFEGLWTPEGYGSGESKPIWRALSVAAIRVCTPSRR